MRYISNLHESNPRIVSKQTHNGYNYGDSLFSETINLTARFARLRPLIFSDFDFNDLQSFF